MTQETKYTKEQILERVRQLVDGRPVRWVDEDTSRGDFAGRDWTIEVFDVTKDDRLALREKLWDLFVEVRTHSGKLLSLITHVPKTSTAHTKEQERVALQDVERASLRANSPWDIVRAMARRTEVAERALVLTDAACADCGEMTDSLTGNPGRWRVSLPRSSAPGVMQAHHMQCVLNRLAERDRLKASVKELNDAFDEQVKEKQVLAMKLKTTATRFSVECDALKERLEAAEECMDQDLQSARRERDALKARVAELEKSLDECDRLRVAAEMARRVDDEKPTHSPSITPMREARKHNVVFDYLSPHNGEYWYKCTVCGAGDWVAHNSAPLTFEDTECVPAPRAQTAAELEEGNVRRQVALEAQVTQLEKECAELRERNEVLTKQVTDLGERLDRCDDARIAVEVERDALKNSRDAANARSTECEPRKDAPAFPRVFPRSTVAALRTFVEQWAHWHSHADQTRSPVNAAACLVVELNQLLDG